MTHGAMTTGDGEAEQAWSRSWLVRAVGGSVAFDHAVGYYDETRGLSEVQADTARLLAELPGVSRVVEVGAGTGLVTVPMTQIGVPMTAVDLSEAMLRRLHEKATAAGFPIPITVADGTRLPSQTTRSMG